MEGREAVLLAPELIERLTKVVVGLLTRALGAVATLPDLIVGRAPELPLPGFE